MKRCQETRKYILTVSKIWLPLSAHVKQNILLAKFCDSNLHVFLEEGSDVLFFPKH